MMKVKKKKCIEQILHEKWPVNGHKELTKSIYNDIMKALTVDTKHTTIVRKETVNEPNGKIGLNDKDIDLFPRVSDEGNFLINTIT